MISVWLGDRSGWTNVRLAELDRSSFVDRSAGSWIGALVRGSELWFVDQSSGLWIGARSLWFVDRSGLERCAWIEALWFVDRSGSELSGSWIGVDRSFGFWIGARSLFLSVLLCVDRSSLVRGSEWIGDMKCGSELVLSFSLCCCAWIGARCVAVCAFVLCFSSLFLSVLLCVESDPEMN